MFDALPSWSSRPRYNHSTHGTNVCLVTQMRMPHLPFGKLLLQGVHKRAIDTIDIYVLLATRAEAAAWQAYLENDILPEAAPGARYAPHGTWVLEELVEVATLREVLREGHSDLAVGAVKKFVGLVAARRRGCELAWLMDIDSVPIRRFSWGEAFELSGKLLAAGLSR